MKFAQLGAIGEEVPVVITYDGTYDLRKVTDKIDGEFLSGRVAEAKQLLDDGRLPRVEDAEALRIGAPIARPSAVICIGMNYAAHAAESGAKPPAHLVVFQKTPNTVVGPNDDVVVPKNAKKLDWEVELGVVIGSRASYLGSPEESEAHIAGYVLANDLSERTWQLEVSGGQWGKGKSGPGFSPVGPWLVTKDEVDVQKLSLRSWVNSEPRQDSSTADMIFDAATIVHELSQYMTLEPGDLILTGTPEGVALSGRFPYLQTDDVVEMEIESLGRQRQNYIPYRKG